jgi:hypothetical protein
VSAFQPFAFIGKVRRLDGSPITVVDVFSDTHVDTNSVSHFVGLLGRVVGSFNAKDGVPLAGGFAFDRDGLDSGAFGQVAVECDGDVTNLREPQSGSATRVFEFEAGLTIGERLILARCFLVQLPDAVAILLPAFERR